MAVLNRELCKLLPTPLQLNVHKLNRMGFLIFESMHALVHMSCFLLIPVDFVFFLMKILICRNSYHGQDFQMSETLTFICFPLKIIFVEYTEYGRHCANFI